MAFRHAFAVWTYWKIRCLYERFKNPSRFFGSRVMRKLAYYDLWLEAQQVHINSFGYWAIAVRIATRGCWRIHLLGIYKQNGRWNVWFPAGYWIIIILEFHLLKRQDGIGWFCISNALFNLFKGWQWGKKAINKVRCLFSYWALWACDNLSFSALEHL